jgi:hypothetical protein
MKFEEYDMQCPVQSRETAEQMLDYCARRLDADTTARLDRHVSVCAECREFVEGQRMVNAALEAYQDFTPRVSDDFDRLLYARIEAEQEEGWWKRAWKQLFVSGEPVGWKPAFSAVAACAVVAGGLFLHQTMNVTPMEAPVESEEPAPLVAKQEIEGLDQALADLEMVALLGTPDEGAPDKNLRVKN